MSARRFLRRHYRMWRYKALNYGKVVDFPVLKGSRKAIHAGVRASVSDFFEQIPTHRERLLDRPWHRRAAQSLTGEQKGNSCHSDQ